MNHAPKAGHPTKGQMANVILGGKYVRALEHEQIVGPIVGQKCVAFGTNDIDTMGIERPSTHR